MKASVQYDDFIGTSAADISDTTDLQKWLSNKNIDTSRYQAIGASFYAGYTDFFSFSIICKDKERSTEEKDHIVSIHFNEEFTKDDFFILFKRFSVIITELGYANHEIDEEINIDNEDD